MDCEMRSLYPGSRPGRIRKKITGSVVLEIPLISKCQVISMADLWRSTMAAVPEVHANCASSWPDEVSSGKAPPTYPLGISHPAGKLTPLIVPHACSTL